MGLAEQARTAWEDERTRIGNRLIDVHGYYARDSAGRALGVPAGNFAEPKAAHAVLGDPRRAGELLLEVDDVRLVAVPVEDEENQTRTWFRLWTLGTCKACGSPVPVGEELPQPSSGWGRGGSLVDIGRALAEGEPVEHGCLPVEILRRLDRPAVVGDEG